MRRRCVLVLAVFAALLAGCSMPRPVVTATSSVLVPSVSSVTTPSVDPVYEEAERVARELARIDQEYLYAGEYDVYPREEIAKYAMDPYLSGLENEYIAYRRERVRIEDADKIKLDFLPVPGYSAYGSEVALKACLDLTQVKSYKNGQLAPVDGIYSEFYYFKHDGSLLKLFRISGEKVTKCELG